MVIGDLFSGIGGFSLAARWMDWTTAWFAEIDPYCTKVLRKHWPGVPNHGDLTKADWSTVEPVDLMAGGFPCQDLSVAGRRKGITGERSGLWSEYARAIRELRPRWVVIENVPPLLTSGFAVVRGDLRAAGYRVARPVLLSASAVGANHIRERLWVVAHLDDADEIRRGGLNGRDDKARRREDVTAGREALADPDGDAGNEWRPGDAEQGEGGRHVDRGRVGANVADPCRSRLAASEQAIVCGAGWWSEGRAASEQGWWAVEPDVGRVAHGVPRRVDRLRGLGNAIVPACALHIFRAIQEAEERLIA